MTMERSIGYSPVSMKRSTGHTLRGGIHNFKNLYELFMKFHEMFMVGS
jgi:hypothetical protein